MTLAARFSKPARQTVSGSSSDSIRTRYRAQLQSFGNFLGHLTHTYMLLETSGVQRPVPNDFQAEPCGSEAPGGDDTLFRGMYREVVLITLDAAKDRPRESNPYFPLSGGGEI